MSWVGAVDLKDLVVTPVGCAGHDDGYLDLLKIRLEGDRSEGPTGQAVRLRQTVVCDDISTDPRMKPWREEALRRGYRSSIGLPLMKADALFGVLTIYSDGPTVSTPRRSGCSKSWPATSHSVSPRSRRPPSTSVPRRR